MGTIMRRILLAGLVMVTCIAGMTSTSFGLLINFTGGTAYLNDGTSVTTNDQETFVGVDYYVEKGVKFDFIGADEYIGDYYGTGNSVIHGHFGWGLEEIMVSMIDESAFDLNYLEITSNTDDPGWPASGDEQTYITANTGYTALLDYSDWGNEGIGDGNVMVRLNEGFDKITSFKISVSDLTNALCFGMDSFYINEEAPAPTIPEPSTVLLLSLGVIGLTTLKRKRSQK